MAGIAAITLLGWGYLWHDASNMTCAMMVMPNHQQFTFMDGLVLFVMWALMMVAMMTPSVTPTMLLLTATLQRQDRTLTRVFLFLSGYLLAWTGFSLLAATAQWNLHRAALLAPTMSFTNRWLSGIVLMAAGAFQWTPWKRSCLKQCQSPLQFLMTSWKEGRTGALQMGLRHGWYCLGCCWLLMLILFAVGVMNLWWVALLSVIVLIEKLIPHRLVSYGTGVVLLALGLWSFWDV